MKKSYFLSVLFSTISFLGFSQITVTDVNLLEIGDVIYLADDDNTIVNIGSAGQNQTWDFSALQSNDSWMMEVVDPTTTPFDHLYPNANLCIIDDGDFIYCNKSSSSVSMLGIGDSVFQQGMAIISLPLNPCPRGTPIKFAIRFLTRLSICSWRLIPITPALPARP